LGSIIIRAASNAAALANALRQAVHQADKDQALTDLKTLEQIKSESAASDRLMSVLFAIFGFVALLLAAIGIYAVISYSVAHRTGVLNGSVCFPAPKLSLALPRGAFLWRLVQRVPAPRTAFLPDSALVCLRVASNLRMELSLWLKKYRAAMLWSSSTI
jgi:hypothetical protein